MERMRLKYRKKSKKTKELSAAEAIFKSSASPPPWIELPKDVTANILHRLCVEDKLESAQRVCTTWREVCRDPSMWRVIDVKCPDEEEEEWCDRMCRCAVDLSQRQLIDLRITRFGDDELLSFIADRSSNLRCLTLAYCVYIDGSTLVESVKKLPKLQELHLTVLPYVEASDIEAIGISRPMLKSFTYNACWSDHSSHDDEPTDWNQFAFAIAKSMPNLRHLQLMTHWMRNEGLEAILDGCLHLESLDIRQCLGLDLKGALGKRCSKQIKHLRCPCDSIRDFEWPYRNYYSSYSESPRFVTFNDDDDDISSFGSFGDPSFDPYTYDDEFDSFGFEPFWF